MKKYILLSALVLALSSVVYADQFRDKNGEEPYLIASSVEGLWAFAIFGADGIGSVSGPIDLLEELIEAQVDARKYIGGERPDVRLFCIKNKNYKRELTFEESNTAYDECASRVVQVRSSRTDWRVDFQKLDPSQESVVVEAFQDTWREMKLALTGEPIDAFNDENHYTWQNLTAEGLFKIGGGICQLVKAPFKVAAGAVTAVVGVVVLPFEEKGHLGDTVRRGVGLALKSALDPITGVLVIAQGSGGPIVYATVTAIGPVVVITKESTAIVSELRNKIQR